MSRYRILPALAVLPGLILGAVTAPLTAGASEVIQETSKDTVYLEASRGALIRLDRPAHTVFVSDPKVADIQVKSPRLVYLLGKTPGETTLIAVDESERVLTNRPVRITHNLTRLRSALKSMLPSRDFEVQSVDKSIIVTGSVDSPTDAADVRRMAERLVEKPEQVIMRMGVTAPTQVQLRVRVAEVSRDVLKQFGINWDALLSSGNFMFGLATGNPVSAAGSFLTRNNNTNSLFGGFSNGSIDINGLIDAMDDEGLITVLAEPNLTSMSGKPATFLAGGEFPIIVPGDENRVTIEFKQFGVSLAFTPTLLGQNRISLHVNPEVSQLSNTGAVELGGYSIPALTTRRAETTVELGNGQSFAIAGLLQNDIRHDIDKFPGLGDVPVLGTLFRSDRFQRNETELVIIVTPYVVRPTSGPLMASPTDGLTPPTDKDRVLHGRLYRPTPRTGDAEPVASAGTRTRGPIGFVLE
jgi:pilus assembly protein CpaC